MSLLAPRIILYIPTRIGPGRFILMDTVHQTPAWSITPAPAGSTGFKIMAESNPSSTTYIGMFVVKNHDGILLNKQIKQHTGIIIKDTTTNQIVPVVSMAQHTTVFGLHKLKANIVFDAPDPFPAPVTTIAPPMPPDSTPALTPVPKVKNLKNTLIPVASGVGDLSQHVANQLFELALLKKEQCPITVEEFSAGNTAVMPCGHLFMQMAIEESFKKEANKCPWCRQLGLPTYV